MTYPEFWLHYLRAHADSRTRLLHMMGTTLALAFLLTALITLDWHFLLAAPIIGYAIAWAAHVGIERNRPATFGHPLWSLLSDLRMLALFATGRLTPHLRRAGLP